MSRIDEIRARCEAATPGPWTWEGDLLTTSSPEYLVLKPYYDDEEYEITTCIMPSNAELIAHAREDIPYLLDEYERLARENTALRSENAEYLRNELNCGTCVNADVSVYEEPCSTCADGYGWPAWEFDEARFT